MKKLTLLFALVGLSLSSLFAQQDYKTVLKSTFDQFDSTQEAQAKLDAGNKLVLIAKKFTNDWAPQYYAAYSRLVLSYLEKDVSKKDAYIDDADNYISQAETLLGKETDEIDVLKAWSASARLSIDPPKRWMKYGKIFEDYLAKAKDINPENPRIYYLKGVNVFYTPQAFGGGKKRAKEYLEKAQTFFANEKHDDIDKPYWGAAANQYFLGQCQTDK